MRIRAAVLLLVLPGCGLLLGYENDWAFGDPPPPLPRTAFDVEGEVRDLATLAPVPGARVVLTTGREGYRREVLADAGGRFAVGFSALAREVGPGDVLAEQVFFGNDPSNDLVGEVALTASAAGYAPRSVTLRIPAAAPVVVHLERLAPGPGPRLLGPFGGATR